MKPLTDVERISAGVVWAVLAMCVVGWPADTHAQPPVPVQGVDLEVYADARERAKPAQPPVPVQDVAGLGILTKLAVTLQMVLAPGAPADVNPLYAYNPQDLAGEEVHPESIGDVATVGRCEAGGTEAEGVTWCARYFTDINQAFRTAYHANRGTDDANNENPVVYFATTYPLPNVEPERRFVSGLSP